MINWIKGDVIDIWQANNKYFILIDCQNLGYEIQILESFFLKLKSNKTSTKNVALWIKLIKKEDTDLLFGFSSRDQKKFFIEILNIRGIGSQIGMSILNNFSIKEVFNAIKTEDKNLMCSVPGIGQKMAERLILELKSKFKKEIDIFEEKNDNKFDFNNTVSQKILDDLELTLQSLNYTRKEINSILPIIIKETNILGKDENIISFENLLKLAMNYLERDSRNIVR